MGREDDEALLAADVARSDLFASSPTFLREGRERVRTLSITQVRDFYSRYIDHDHAHAAVFRPASQKPVARASGGGEPGPRVEPAPRDLLGPTVDAPTIRGWLEPPGVSTAARATLDNGLDVVVLRRPRARVHEAILAFHGGSADAPAAGVGTAAAWPLNDAPAGNILSRLGVTYASYVTRDTVLQVVRGPGSAIQSSLEQLRKAAPPRTLRWPSPGLARSLPGREQDEGAPSALLRRRMNDALYGPHAFGHEDTAADLRTVAREDLDRFIESIVRPANGLLVVVGDVDPEMTLAVARRQFADSVEGTSPASAPPKTGPVPLEHVSAPADRRLLIQNEPSADRTAITFECLLPKADADRYEATRVVAQALDAELDGVLRRDTAAPSAVVHNVVMLRGGTALLEMHANVEDAALVSALGTVRRFIGRASSDFITPEKVLRAQRDEARLLETRYATTDAAARAVVSAWNLGWDPRWLDSLPDQLLAVKADEVVALAEHCRANSIVGVLGNEARIKAALATTTAASP
jgi:predicted Zn-dependent peptidase